MGNSLPPPAAIDLVGSFARRRGAEVEIVLSDPKTDIGEAASAVTLTKGGKSVVAHGTVADDQGGRRLTIRAPRASFSDGVWAMSLNAGASTEAPVGARLLVQGDRPLVLLWGASGPHSAASARDISATRRAAVAASAGLDRVLSVLPPKQASKIRAKAEEVARRVIT